MKDYTEGSEDQKTHRAKKMMLWFGIISLGMSFAGLTSAYIVSRTSDVWLKDLALPQAFYLSLVVIVLSSFTMHFAKTKVMKEERKISMLLLWTTFLLGTAFIWLQFKGFSEMINDFGINFTGPTSTTKGTFIFLIAAVHIAHVVVALISVLVVIYNHYKQRYKDGKTLGIELAATFWHFVDILWIYLFLFFYFVR
jgi:cytochrome c oxidase subunit 3